MCTVCSLSVHTVFSKCAQCTVCSQEVFEGSPTSHGIQRAHTIHQFTAICNITIYKIRSPLYERTKKLKFTRYSSDFAAEL